MKRFLSFLVAFICIAGMAAQNIPQHITYTRIYDFLDELAGDGIVELNSAIKPYSRNVIAEKLQEAQTKDSLLNHRQKADLKFFLNDYALECDTLPRTYVHWTNKRTFDLGLAQPSFHYRDKLFKCRIFPLLGMDVIANKKGVITKRWYGAEIQATIADHVSVWGSLRDISFNGTAFLRDAYYATNADKIKGAKLTMPAYLNNLSGCQYKEANYGGDFSDSRGGIKAYTKWGSIGLIKDNIVWGDTYHCSNILSGRAPSFPMVTLNIKPVRWFELNYFHAWLISNVVDSTNYYIENRGTTSEKKHYRPANKFMAANMLTFTPIPKLSFSIGNSIVYAENNVQAAYFIPIAFYKSIDHLLTKGLAVENQNSQAFLTVSTRNLKHLHVYGSVFVDEIKFSRFKKSNAEHNPISYQVGLNVSNWPLQNLSLKGEFTRTNIAVYEHSIDVLTWASNTYDLGHYMGANSQNAYVSLEYKPIRSLFLGLSYSNDVKYNCYDYLRGNIRQIISQKPFNEKTWQNDTFAFDAVYEVFNNCYAVVNLSYNYARGFAPTSDKIDGEDRPDGVDLASYYLNQFSPVFYQGKNLTFTCGLSFGF